MTGSRKLGTSEDQNLCSKAAGMFRWVDCQLQAIRKCKGSVDLKGSMDLKKSLNMLLEDVHEQHARESADIPENCAQDALKILQWLTFPKQR